MFTPTDKKDVNPYSVTISAALRMVADLADADKVLAVISGGVAGRVFHPHAADQIGAFMDGEKMYWWFSDREIANHTRSVLMLTPLLCLLIDHALPYG